MCHCSVTEHKEVNGKTELFVSFTVPSLIQCPLCTDSWWQDRFQNTLWFSATWKHFVCSAWDTICISNLLLQCPGELQEKVQELVTERRKGHSERVDQLLCAYRSLDVLLFAHHIAPIKTNYSTKCQVSWNCESNPKRTNSLEKPPVVQLLKNLPLFYGTRSFIAVYAYPKPDQSYLSEIHFNIVMYQGVCVTNNNGFWIWWLDLLAFLYNYSRLLTSHTLNSFWTTSVLQISH
jgi:hypothetical protein